MVGRIARLLGDSSRIVTAVTFTRDGAHELRARVAEAVGEPERLSRVTVGTFHSLTLRHLEKAGLKPALATPMQANSFLRRTLAEHAPKSSADEMRQAFEEIKCSLEPEKHPRFLEPWYQAYEAALVRHGLVDLQDIMRIAVLAMRAGTLPPLICTDLIVDEAQDNDQVQAAWIAAHRQATITMVGDDDQTIYEWRRAIGFPGMLAFQKDRDADVIVLEDNFRSRKEILDAAGELIAQNNPYRNPKKLIARRGSGGSVRKVVTGSSKDTCQAVQGLIAPFCKPLEKSRRHDSVWGVDTGTWAVLARTNRQLDLAESFLSDAQIKSVRSAGSVWDTQAAQVALQTLRAVLTGDSVAVETALSHTRLQHAVIIEFVAANRKCLPAILRGEVAPVGDVPSDLLDALQMLGSWYPGLTGDASEALASVMKEVQDFVLLHLPQRAKAGAEVILGSLRKKVLRSPGQVSALVESLTMNRQTRDDAQAVQLFTMHGCKGLEFDNVIVVGLESEAIPGDAIALPPGAPGIRSGQSTVQSERRLLYVAMTRARERLFLVQPFANPSPFLSELPSWVEAVSVSDLEPLSGAQAR